MGFRNIDGLTIGMTNEELNDDYGKYYQIEIFISNNRDTALLFNPEEVYAELITKKGDTLDLEALRRGISERCRYGRRPLSTPNTRLGDSQVVEDSHLRYF